MIFESYNYLRIKDWVIENFQVVLSKILKSKTDYGCCDELKRSIKNRTEKNLKLK